MCGTEYVINANYIVLQHRQFTEGVDTASLTDKRKRVSDVELTSHELSQLRAVAGSGQDAELC